jgi:sucrose phosphorylase
MSLLVDARSRIESTPVEALFSERDVVLITYGDTLQTEGESPLQTLHQFARSRLKDVISAIHILPFYPYSSDDGFSVKDFYAVNPDLGDWDNVEALREDFALMFDAVFNHMSAQSEWFKRFLADDPEYADLFLTESPDTDLSGITRPRATPLLTPMQKANGDTVYVWTTFSADQVDFNVSSPDTLIRLLEILLFYVEKGAKFIRLDAVAYLWKAIGTTGIHLEQTHLFIRLMRAVLDEVAPYIMIITETNVPHHENISYFGDGDNEAQMVYNFTLPPLLFHTVLSGNSEKLRNWVNTLKTPSNRTTFFNFTASHDGIGVRPIEGILTDNERNALIAHVEACGGRVSYTRNRDGSQSPYELNCAYVDAITDPSEPEAMQIKRFLMSQAIAMSIAGVPAIYIHSLLGSHNYIEGMAQTGQNRTINREKLDAATINAELNNPSSFRAKILNGYIALLAKRVQHRAFHPNSAQQALDLHNDHVFALLRTAVDDSERILAVFNICNQEQPVDLSQWLQTPSPDLLSGQAVEAQTVLPPYAVYFIPLP